MTVTAYRDRLYARRAAAAGLTLEQWHARNEATQRELDHYHALRHSHAAQIAVIAQHAGRNNRRFARLSIGG